MRVTVTRGFPDFFAGKIEESEEVFFDCDLEEEKRRKLVDLADRRWRASLSVTFQGAQIACDVASTTNVMGAIISMQLPGGPASRKWKVAAGEVRELALQDLVALGQAMAAHVQACFDHEAALAAKIVSLKDQGEVCDFDVESGWPA